MSLIAKLFGADVAAPPDAKKLDGTTEATLAHSLSALPPDERGWITFAEARILFSTKGAHPKGSVKSCCLMVRRENRSGRSDRNDGFVALARSHGADAGWTKLFQAPSLTLSKLRCASDAASVKST
jgi:hypothetical protein